MNQNIIDRVQKVVTVGKVLVSEPMKQHTTFRVGGPADLFVAPATVEELKAVIAICKEEDEPYYIVGNGSNLLVSDQGYRGVIVQMSRAMSNVTVEGTLVKAEAGATLFAVANRALEAGLTGFEFAAGIPGTLGGACVMNAGAYGGEMKQVLEDVTVVTKEGDVKVIPVDEMDLSYRHSIVPEMEYIVVGASIRLAEGDREQIKARMEELKVQRVTKQPLEYPSAGSTFKRPEGYFAGKLIQDAGLKGFQVGGAQVSEKHSGFVINKDNATAADITELMKQVADRVEEKFGVRLEPEVKRIGE